jgi:tRNA pseudouridine38-40 synthase
VHASGQVIAFDLDWRHSPEVLLRALNANLPPDVSAQVRSRLQGGFTPATTLAHGGTATTSFASQTRSLTGALCLAGVACGELELDAASSWLPGPRQATSPLLASRPGLEAARFEPFFRLSGRFLTWPHQNAVLIFEVRADAFLYHMVRAW